MTLVLYDLAGADDRVRFSPYCWRVKMALKHKGLDWQAIPWRFTEKDVIAFSGQGAVPVLVDDGKCVTDSWEIARYLEANYPGGPSLFGGAVGEAQALFIKFWCEQTVHPLILRLILPDVFLRLHEKDKTYFRQTREARLGCTLEQASVPVDQGVTALHGALAPLRSTLERQNYLGGGAPTFADYIVFAAFQWARSASSIEMLDPADPVHGWFERLLDAFDGFARRSPARSGH